MASLLILAGVCAVALVAVLLRRRAGHDGGSPDLGTLSSHWLAEQRLGPGRDR